MKKTAIPSFYIQCGTPRTSQIDRASAYDLSEAVESLFSSPTECLIMYWNQVPIPLDYKYDIADHIHVIVEMVSTIAEQPSGRTKEILASNDFFVTWDISWDCNSLSVLSEWVRVRGDVESISVHCHKLLVPRDRFLLEWSILLGRVYTVVQSSGLVLEDKKHMKMISRFLSLRFDDLSDGYLYGNSQ